MPEVKEKKVEPIKLFYDLIGALVVFGFMDRPYVPLRFSDSYRR